MPLFWAQPCLAALLLLARAPVSGRHSPTVPTGTGMGKEKEGLHTAGTCPHWHFSLWHNGRRVEGFSEYSLARPACPPQQPLRGRKRQVSQPVPAPRKGKKKALWGKEGMLVGWQVSVQGSHFSQACP